MVSWTKNNTAHRLLWIFVRSEHIDFAISGEQMTSFIEGGDWDNKFVIGGAAGDTPEMIKSKAKIFSTKFNSWIINKHEAEYETGLKPATAITTLTKAFAKPDSKVKDCGDIVDQIFKCQGE